MLSREFDYDLPEDAIAQVPAEPRDAARLLVDLGDGVEHRRTFELPELLQPGDLVVINDTKVLPSRLELRRPSGGRVEALLLEPVSGRSWQALLRPSRKLHAGDSLDGPVTVILEQSLGEGRWQISIGGDEAVEQLLERHGSLPLPPYIRSPLDDPSRYQTVYARRPASAAAPTAGLHLTDATFAGFAAQAVSVARLELVVGLGTFRPLTSDVVEEHQMHSEWYRIDEATRAALADARRIVAVGTTTVRALESYGATGQAEGRTSLFIRRGFEFRLVDVLLTNFHVPRSSLLVMLDAFVGPRWRALYDEALHEGYRFLSLGDAMLVNRAR